MKAKFLTILVLVCFVQVALTGGAILNVPSTEYPTIQSAIDTASDGDTVQVVAGTYQENLRCDDKSIFLIGAGAEITIVDANGSGVCLIMINVPSSARVEGFTFTGGVNPNYGGGISFINSSATLANNIIEGNSATHGGGLWLSDSEGSSPTLINNIIRGNSGRGGGISLFANSSATLLGNTIVDNSAYCGEGCAAWGGGLYAYYASVVLIDNTITGNHAANGGGGFYCNNSSAILTGNTITDNSSSGGGGIVMMHSSPTLTDNIIARNSATISNGGGLYMTHDSSPTLNNNIIENNSAAMFGGGLYLTGFLSELTGNDISGNTAQSGGGIYINASDLTLANNTITHNEATGEGSTYGGGGVYLRYSFAEIRDNIITDNSVKWSGGGLYLDHSSPVMTNNTVSNNSCGEAGGGVYLRYSFAEIRDNTITGNVSGYVGGGLHFIGYSPTVTENTIAGNMALSGGGLYLNNSSPTLTNNVVICNMATGYGSPQIFGGGFFLENLSCPTLTNNTIASNIGGGLFNYDNPSLPYGTPVITNCILWGNSDFDLGGAESTITYSDVGLGYVEDEGNISAEPMFLRLGNDGGDGWRDDPATSEVDEGANDDYGDYHLQSGSPCIDAGSNLAPNLPETDKDGNPRIYGDVVVDMGAYEASVIEVAIDIKPGSEDGDDNTISLGTQGLIPVAIFSTGDFDATDVIPDTVQLAGAEVNILGKSNEFMAQETDVNGDGLMDLVVHVATANFSPEVVQEGKAVLTGSTNAEQSFVGWDYVTIVPPEE